MAQTRGNARVAAVLVLAVVVVALEAGVTRSASAGGKKCGRLSCQTTPTGVSEQGTVTNPASPPANDPHDTHSTGPATQTTYTPPCGHNTPDDGDLMCMEGAVRCDPANPNARATAATSSVSTTTQTTHTYTTLGTVNVTVTVVYRGEYALPGGQFQAIPGTAQQTSDPVALTVDQIQSVND